MSDTENHVEKKTNSKPIIVRSTTDVQRLKLEKLMKNPDKPIIIPEKPKERGIPTVPDFVRNVMGSSAGAGSGEFHVYRHLRRKEYARQRYMKATAEKEKLDNEYKDKLETNKTAAEEKTAKKRAKRLKKKQKLKGKRQKIEKQSESESEETSDEEAGPDMNVEENENCSEKDVTKLTKSDDDTRDVDAESSQESESHKKNNKEDVNGKENDDKLKESIADNKED